MTFTLLIGSWGLRPQGLATGARSSSQRPTAHFLAKDTVLWLEDFEGGFPGSMTTYKLGDQSSEGWQEYTSSSNWSSFGAGPMGNISTGHDDDEASCDDWIVSPAMEVPPNSRAYLSFYYGTKWGDWAEYRGIWVSTGSGDPSDGDFVEFANLTDSISNDAWTKLEFDLSAYAGQTVYIAFRYQGNFADEFYLDSIAVRWEAVHTDLAAELLEPSSPYPVGSSVTPSASLKNLGDENAGGVLTVFNIYDPSGALVYSDTQTVDVAPGDSVALSFSDFAFPSIGPYIAEVYHAWTNDTNPGNDTSRASVGAIRYSYTAYATASSPTIDGTLDDPAWQEADTLDISDFLGYVDEPDTLGTALVLAVHNFDTLFLGIVASAASTNSSLGLTFDDNDDGQWPATDTTEGHNLITPLRWDYKYMTQGGGGSWTTLDPSPPFAVSYSAGQVSVEVAIPIVHDPAEDAGPWTLLSAVAQGSGDTVGFLVYYLDNGKIKGWWPQDAEDGLGENPAYFGDLILEGEMTAGERAGAEAPSLQVLGVRRPVISLNLPSAASVRVEVYDVSGRLVKTLLDGRAEAGLHKLSVGQLKPGVYSVLAKVGGRVYGVNFLAK